MTGRQVTNYCPNCKELADRNAELLEALESCFYWIDENNAPNDIITRANAVIAKAKGENHV